MNDGFTFNVVISNCFFHCLIRCRISVFWKEGKLKRLGKVFSIDTFGAIA